MIWFPILEYLSEHLHAIRHPLGVVYFRSNEVFLRSYWARICPKDKEVPPFLQ